jgi:Site-specific recombinase XerD
LKVYPYRPPIPHQIKRRLKMAKKRADGRYQKSFTHEGRRYTVYGRTNAELTQAVADKLQTLQSQKADHDDPLLKDYLERFVEYKRNKIKSPTVNSYMNFNRRFSQVTLPSGIRLVDLRLSEITPMDIKDTQQLLLDDGCISSTVNGYMVYLSSVLTQAVKEDLIDKHPCRLMESVRRTEMPAKDTIHRNLTDDEISKILTAAKTTYISQLLVVLLHTGMRVGEACSLLPSDVDMVNNIIHVTKTVSTSEDGNHVISSTPKTNTSNRTIPMTPAAKQAILNQMEYNKSMRFVGQIFLTGAGKTVTATRADYFLRKLCRQTGIERVTCHAFRHTFATRFIEQRPGEYKTLQAILGHANINMTLGLYAHITDETKAKAMQDIYIPTVI